MHDDHEHHHHHDHAEEEGPEMQARAKAHLQAESADAWAKALIAGDAEAVSAMLEDRPRRANQFLSQDRPWGLEMWMPLHFAAQGGHDAVVRLLLERGIRPECRTRFATPMHARRTPLHFAAEAGDLGVMTALLDAGADADVLDARSDRPVHLAARRGHADAVRLLVECGADPEAKNGNARTPLHEAIRSDDGVADGDANAAALTLLELGANPEAECPKEALFRTPVLRCEAMGARRDAVLAELRRRLA
ncbi:MAG: ankyrin repeat domain-containing protein [Planctomycetota bacterium]